MKNFYAEKDEDLRSIDRTQYRNMSSDCMYCGYRSRPSLSQDDCCQNCFVLGSRKNK